MTPPAHFAGSAYRADIDGLRAIAVLAVLAYHAFPSALPGGFVGVDIFFVISGYLISRHILEELATRSFSLRSFYARRVRRIFPALILVMFVCLALGWLLLTPGEYERLGRHVFAGSLFLANILSWRESGYFDAAADTKPLLHLWSLGIEEQFYIAWPLILLALWRVRRWLGWAMAALIGLSLAWSLTTIRHDPVADFYSPLTRFWELALGALLAWVARAQGPGVLPVAPGTRVSLLGLVLVAVSVLVISSNDAFPGAWALLPTVGAALLIYAGPAALPNRALLAARSMVWIGLISYPLYLWHWPLLTLARILEGETPSASMRWLLLGLSVLMAWLTWRFVERPLRAGPKSRALIWALCLCMAAVGIAGFVVKSAHGYRDRLAGLMNGDPTTMVIGADRGRLLPGCGVEQGREQGLNYCVRSREAAPRYAVVGDSKAEALFYGLVRESVAATSWGLIGTVYPPDPATAFAEVQRRKNALAFDSLEVSGDVQVVILVTAMRTVFPPDPVSGFIRPDAPLPASRLQSYSDAITRLQRSGKQVVLVIDNPTFPDPTSCVSGGLTGQPWFDQVLRRKEDPRCRLKLSDHLAGTRPYLDFISELQRRHPALVVYDPTPLLCDLARDVCPMTQGGKFLYSYGDHLSDHASSMIARDLLPRVLPQLVRQAASP
ncbi:MAG: acyltransferase [Curvibacter sp.]|nr:acyltransferase [Curvibacter sp.]